MNIPEKDPEHPCRQPTPPPEVVPLKFGVPLVKVPLPEREVSEPPVKESPMLTVSAEKSAVRVPDPAEPGVPLPVKVGVDGETSENERVPVSALISLTEVGRSPRFVGVSFVSDALSSVPLSGGGGGTSAFLSVIVGWVLPSGT